MSRAPRKPPLPPPDREPTFRPSAVGAARTRALVLCPAKADHPQDGRTERGRLEEAVGLAEAIDLVVVDAALSAVQQRNLERACSCKVIDRTGLILEIFGERARTREGRLQVELAALTYQRSRLVRSWTHLERQRGGFGFLGGPGESQIELDRRRIEDRITRIWCCTCATWPIPRARHSATTCSRCCAAWSWASWPTKGGCWSSGTSSTCC